MAPPNIRIDAPQNGTNFNYNSSVTINVTCNDSRSGASWAFTNDSRWDADSSPPFNLTSNAPLADQPYSLKVSCNDSAGNVNYSQVYFSVFPPEQVVSCGALGTPNRVYTLLNNVSSSGTCFTVSAQNLTIDCAGHEIDYATSAVGYGVYSEYHNTTIKNCTIVGGSASGLGSYAIFISGANQSTIANNVIQTNSQTAHGIQLLSASHSLVVNNSIAALGLYARGISVYSGSASNTFVNDNVTIGATSLYGIIFEKDGGSNFVSSSKVNASNGTYYGGAGIVFCDDAAPNYVNDSTVLFSNAYGCLATCNYASGYLYNDAITNTAYSPGQYDVLFWMGGVNQGTLNFINTAFNKTNVHFVQDNHFDVYWLADTHTVDQSGSDLPGVSVSISDVNGNLLYSGLTNSTGWLARQTILEYEQTNDSAITNFTPHWFNASKTGRNANNTASAVSENHVGSNAIVRTLYLQGNVTVYLNSPPDGQWNASRNISFAYTPEAWNYGFSNATLWTNFTGVWAAGNPNASAITNNSVNTITVNGTPEGQFIWNVEV